MVYREVIDGRRINRISLGLGPVTRHRFSEKIPDEKRFPIKLSGRVIGRGVTGVICIARRAIVWQAASLSRTTAANVFFLRRLSCLPAPIRLWTSILSYCNKRLSSPFPP